MMRSNEMCTDLVVGWGWGGVMGSELFREGKRERGHSEAGFALIHHSH